MREIKFRAWDGKYKKYYYMDNCDFIIERDGASVFSEFSSDRINKSWKLEQYTGLKDMNDIEIYEGDIIETRFPDNNLVYWDDEYSMFAYRHKTAWGNSLFELYRSLADTEIIGNINETPELLK